MRVITPMISNIIVSSTPSSSSSSRPLGLAPSRKYQEVGAMALWEPSIRVPRKRGRRRLPIYGDRPSSGPTESLPPGGGRHGVTVIVPPPLSTKSNTPQHGRQSTRPRLGRMPLALGPHWASPETPANRDHGTPHLGGWAGPHSQPPELEPRRPARQGGEVAPRGRPSPRPYRPGGRGQGRRPKAVMK